MNTLDILRGTRGVSTEKLAEDQGIRIEEYFVRKGMKEAFDKIASDINPSLPAGEESTLDKLRRK